jgi:hypothetical protein
MAVAVVAMAMATGISGLLVVAMVAMAVTAMAVAVVAMAVVVVAMAMATASPFGPLHQGFSMH